MNVYLILLVSLIGISTSQAMEEGKEKCKKIFEIQKKIMDPGVIKDIDIEINVKNQEGIIEYAETHSKTWVDYQNALNYQKSLFDQLKDRRTDQNINSPEIIQLTKNYKQAKKETKLKDKIWQQSITGKDREKNVTGYPLALNIENQIISNGEVDNADLAQEPEELDVQIKKLNFLKVAYDKAKSELHEFDNTEMVVSSGFDFSEDEIIEIIDRERLRSEKEIALLHASCEYLVQCVCVAYSEMFQAQKNQESAINALHAWVEIHGDAEESEEFMKLYKNVEVAHGEFSLKSDVFDQVYDDHEQVVLLYKSSVDVFMATYCDSTNQQLPVSKNFFSQHKKVMSAISFILVGISAGLIYYKNQSSQKKPPAS